MPGFETALKLQLHFLIRDMVWYIAVALTRLSVMLTGHFVAIALT